MYRFLLVSTTKERERAGALGQIWVWEVAKEGFPDKVMGGPCSSFHHLGHPTLCLSSPPCWTGQPLHLPDGVQVLMQSLSNNCAWDLIVRG